MVHKSWDSLEKDTINKVQSATSEAQIQSYLRLKEYLEWFYSVPQGVRYRRTGHLGESAELGSYSTNSTGANAIINIDISPFYTTGSYDTPKVFEEAEIHGSGIRGVPNFWGNTMTDMENEIIPNAFGKYFRHK